MRRFLLALVALAIVCGAAFWFLTKPQTVGAGILPAHTPNLENGRTMFYAGGCTSCHAVPDAEDKTRLGGGLELKTRFGSFFVPNISPDPTDGIGSWSGDEIADFLKTGLTPDFDSAGGSMAEVIQNTSRLSDEDRKTIAAYLVTLPAIPGKAPPKKS